MTLSNSGGPSKFEMINEPTAQSLGENQLFFFHTVTSATVDLCQYVPTVGSIAANESPSRSCCRSLRNHVLLLPQ